MRWRALRRARRTTRRGRLPAGRSRHLTGVVKLAAGRTSGGLSPTIRRVLFESAEGTHVIPTPTHRQWAPPPSSPDSRCCSAPSYRRRGPWPPPTAPASSSTRRTSRAAARTRRSRTSSSSSTTRPTAAVSLAGWSFQYRAADRRGAVHEHRRPHWLHRARRATSSCSSRRTARTVSRRCPLPTP